MPLNITWSPEALDDLQRLHDFLAPKSASAAAQAVVDLVDYADFISENNGLALPLAQFAPQDVRRGFVSHYEMRFEFDLTRGALDVLRIFHERENR